ncbi:MAG TPA: LysE family translocator, partial [Gemmatimonadales bacterium]|nr:LysE family translocator [Gemmatimonadales bacterium]
YVGAVYLMYLGIRLWNAPPVRFEARAAEPVGVGRRFLEGLSLQLTNPKAIFFFLSVFPQFIDRSRDFGSQFALLVLTYSTLVIVIHCGYALTAQRAKRWLTSERGGRAVNRAGGAAFVFFGAALATARR